MEQEEPDTPDVEDLESHLNKSTIYAMNLRTAASYNFKTFDPIEDLKGVISYNALIVAKSGSGKSVFVRDIISQTKHLYTETYVFCATANLQPALYDFVRKENIFLTFDEVKLQEIYNKQEAQIIRLMKSGVEKKDCPKILIILDDLISDPAVRKSKLLLKLYISGRHCVITTIFLTQTLNGIGPSMRKNVQLAIGYFLENEDDRKAFANSYLSTKTNRLGVMVFDRITKVPYQAVVILNHIVEKQSPENYVRQYIANPKVKDFKMGGGLKQDNIPFPQMSIDRIHIPSSFTIKTRAKK